MPPMHRRTARSRRVLVSATVVAALGLAGCATAAPSAPQAQSGSVSSSGAPGSTQPTPSAGLVLDLPVPASVSSIDFTNQAGQKVTLASLHGKTVVLTDFLTLCQEICPLTSTNFRHMQNTVAQAGQTSDVEFVEITVDPERDTPARLAAYQTLFGAKTNWQFLTASVAQIAATWKAFAVYYAKVAESPSPPQMDWMTGKPLTYDVNHQDVVIVLGPDGHERWLILGTPNTGGAQPPSALVTFLNDEGHKNLAAPSAAGWTTAQVEQGIAYVSGRPLH